jgi:hypothetical protein
MRGRMRVRGQITESNQARPAGRSAALAVCAGIAVALVLFRCYPSLAFEQYDFDSDQSILGLMAKHLSEFKGFPLFLYGQHYMLGVEAWIAAPFFVIGGPTIQMLKLPMVLMNVAAALWLLREVARSSGSPWLALVACLPFLVTTPAISAHLIQSTGGSAEPLVWVLVLWALRRRPLLFGLLLAVGTLEREFTIYALAGTVVGLWMERRAHPDAQPWRPLRWAAITASGFAIVWIAVDLLKRRINTYGPGAQAVETKSLSMQISSLLSRVDVHPGDMLARLWALATEGLPDLFGGAPMTPFKYNINSQMAVGSRIAGAALLIALVICLAGVVWALLASRSQRPARIAPFTVFLALVSLQSTLAYSLSSDAVPGMPPMLRYVLLSLYLPVAVVAAFFEIERRRSLRALVVSLLVVFAVPGLVDGGRIIADYTRHPPPNEHRALVDDLMSRHIRYGYGIYWDAYITAFLSREQVILASTDNARIGEYQDRVDRNRRFAVKVVRQPCTGGRQVSAWCIVPADENSSFSK